MPDNLSFLSVMTRRYIRTSPKLVDNIFNQDALNVMLRQSLKEDFPGGDTINENFLYDTLIGGGYQKGKSFNTAQKQTEQQCRFDMKYMQVGVTLFEEDIEVINRGPQAVISLLKTRVDQAYLALGAFVSIAAYLPGVGDTYIANVNGLPEIINNGTNQSWDGSAYATYGGLTRATYSPALNSPAPVNIGGGSIEYDTVDSAYTDVMYGSGEYEPNLILTTPKGFSYLKQKFQTQQRFQDTKLEAGVGFRGLSFNGATVVASRYVPGSIIATSGTDANKVALNYLRETTGDNTATYPTGNLQSGESMFILNARKPWLNYYVSNSPKFGGGFRDFIPSANNTVLVGQVLLAHQMTGNPKMHQQVFGFVS